MNSTAGVASSRHMLALFSAFESLAVLRLAGVRILVVCVFLSASVVLGQADRPTSSGAKKSDPLISQNKMMYGVMKTWLLSSAEKMPDEDYGFRPTESVRSYGQILGHIADQQYLQCSRVLDEKDPNPQLEKNVTSKTEMIVALKAVFSYCDRAYESVNEETADQIVRFGPQEFPKLGVLVINLLHSTLHYGNLITYMRLKNIVPPSSEPPFARRQEP